MLWKLGTLRETWKAQHRYSNESDQFIMLDSCMTGSGIRLPSGRSQLYKAFRLVLFLSTSLRWSTFLLNFSKWGSYGAALNNLHVLTAVLVTLVRGIWIQMNIKEFTEAKSYINGRRFRPNDGRSTEIRRETYQQIHLLVTVYLIAQATAYAPLMVIDLRRIPPLRNPIEVRDMTSDGFQLFLDKLYAVMLLPYGASAVTNVLTTYMLLEGFIVEMQIIANSFGEIFDSIANQPEDDFWRELQANFKICAEQHITCLNYLKNTRPLLNGTLLVVYFSTGFFISTGAVYIMWTKKLEMFKFQIFYLIAFNVLECFFFSILVERIKRVHNSVGEQVYNLTWHTNLRYNKAFEKDYIAIRETMLIVMHSAERPLGISCGGLFELGMERFYEMMKLSYQLVMFLWNVADD
ncbi:uncharacterized protein LOC129775464 [Toxorhynchites rutilus septentrionalis]|uniref:uncharacterized protein LOC129775464 n=1 Tax=Toxorhynchites rutilus septentrionalis TaxID=329112 RepID=UPI002479F6BD|nr:uncharacterized protein LOC129775464 [Toxorhynchites rutilus septentrionalis]